MSRRASRSRRKFLGATTAMAGYWVSGVSARAENRSPNEKLNVACIGAGGKGETNILGVMKENVVAVVDVDEQRGAKGFKLVPKAKRYVDYREMFDKEKSLDAVIVSTPDHSHGPASLIALRRGLHVYCEKPLAHSIYETRLMQKIAAEMKVATQMGNQGHSGPVLREAVEVIRSGAIGKVTQFHAWTNRPSWPQGIPTPTGNATPPAHLNWDLWLGPAKERAYSDAYCPFKWRGWWDFGTGALGDMACHIVDLGFWALNLAYPNRVTVVEAVGTQPESGPKSSVLRYDFPARGDDPAVTFQWYDGGKKPDPSLVSGQELPGNGSILVGDKGTMFVPSEYGSKYMLLPKEKFQDYKPPTPTIPRTTTSRSEIFVAANHYAEWIAACKGGKPSLANFDYSALLTEVVLLGNLAVRSGKAIEWDAEQMKARGVPEADEWIKPTYRAGWTL